MVCTPGYDTQPCDSWKEGNLTEKTTFFKEGQCRINDYIIRPVVMFWLPQLVAGYLLPLCVSTITHDRMVHAQQLSFARGLSGDAGALSSLCCRYRSTAAQTRRCSNTTILLHAYYSDGLFLSMPWTTLLTLYGCTNKCNWHGFDLR